MRVAQLRRPGPGFAALTDAAPGTVAASPSVPPLETPSDLVTATLNSIRERGPPQVEVPARAPPVLDLWSGEVLDEPGAPGLRAVEPPGSPARANATITRPRRQRTDRVRAVAPRRACSSASAMQGRSPSRSPTCDGVEHRRGDSRSRPIPRKSRAVHPAVRAPQPVRYVRRSGSTSSDVTSWSESRLEDRAVPTSACSPKPADRPGGAPSPMRQAARTGSDPSSAALRSPARELGVPRTHATSRASSAPTSVLESYSETFTPTTGSPASSTTIPATELERESSTVTGCVPPESIAPTACRAGGNPGAFTTSS